MNLPLSTYRIQFNKDFTFRHFEGIIDYLYALGITTVYASPIFKAAPESTHGYDVCDPYVINPEIGTIEELYNINKKLKEKNISWLQDIVPNHMAFNASNTKFWDVLEKKELSDFFEWFDIDWNHPDKDLNGKVMVPFLGDSLENCINNNEINIIYKDEKYFINYADTLYPCNISSTQKIKNTDDVNNSKALLKQTLEEQFYLLCKYDETNKRINYRRFFTVNQLICLNIQNEKVFTAYHKFIKQLYDDGIFNGIRIDHIDGLYDPKEYIDRLRNLLGEDAYIIAEKILEPNEYLPNNWDIQGTSGYEFLSYTSQLITNKTGSKKLLDFYKNISHRSETYEEVVFTKKQAFLNNYMQGELNNLTDLLHSTVINISFSKDEIREAIGLFMVCLPVYRVYPRNNLLNKVEQEYIEEAKNKAIAKNKNIAQQILFITDFFKDKNALAFTQRLMQFTGPLTAKGVEDTTFYVYNPLVAHNEVGDSPAKLGESVNVFHEKMIRRQKQNPLSINTTSTHDTKRGEDARIKISLISQFADEWQMLTQQWFQDNQQFYSVINNVSVPSANEAYFIYQNILGGYPASGDFNEACLNRYKEYITKAFREAKENTKHEAPNEEYEKAIMNFIENIMKPESLFLKSFQPFYDKINNAAFTLSLTQTLIKLTAPGISDIYQGAELWDLSYVDPDNRRSVDYNLRKRLLNDIHSYDPSSLLSYLYKNRASGIEKLFLIQKLLEFRKANFDLFIYGDYQAIEINNDELISYKRTLKNKQILIIAPLSITGKSVDTAELQFTQNEIWTNIFTNTILNDSVTFKELLKDFPVAILKNF